MAVKQPETKLDQNFSTPNATAVPWSEGSRQLEQAEMYWITTIRPEGRPHVVPVIGAFLDGVFYFSTGAGERKAKNLAQNPNVVISTGRNALKSAALDQLFADPAAAADLESDQLDLVLEGTAVRITDTAKLQHISDAYFAKYGEAWRFTVADGGWNIAAGSPAEAEPAAIIVFEVAPTTAFGFGRGAGFSQTRWRF